MENMNDVVAIWKEKDNCEVVIQLLEITLKDDCILLNAVEPNYDESKPYKIIVKDGTVIDLSEVLISSSGEVGIMYSEYYPIWGDRVYEFTPIREVIEKELKKIGFGVASHILFIDEKGIEVQYSEIIKFINDYLLNMIIEKMNSSSQ